jgi:hypothetical protein
VWHSKKLVRNGHVANISTNVLFPRCSKNPHVTNVCQICQSWETGFTEDYNSTVDSLLNRTCYLQYVVAISQTCLWASSRDNHPFIIRPEYFHFTTSISYITQSTLMFPNKIPVAFYFSSPRIGSYTIFHKKQL